MTATVQHSVSRIITVWMVALAVVVAPLAMREAYADTSQDQARKHYEAGRDLYASGDYRAAIREFETANKLVPSPVLDFNIGLAYERLGVLDKALAHYKAYIHAMPNAGNRTAVEAKIQALEQELAAVSKAEPTALDTADTTQPPTSTTVTSEPASDVTATTATTTDTPAVDSDAGAQRDVNPPSAPVYEPTGDAMLDRAAAINLAELREQRASHLAAASEPARDQSAAPVDHATSTPKKAKPVYKKWWFWVVVGVSTVILIDMASGSNTDMTTPVARDVPGSPVLMRF